MGERHHRNRSSGEVDAGRAASIHGKHERAVAKPVGEFGGSVGVLVESMPLAPLEQGSHFATRCAWGQASGSSSGEYGPPSLSCVPPTFSKGSPVRAAPTPPDVACVSCRPKKDSTQLMIMQGIKLC